MRSLRTAAISIAICAIVFGSSRAAPIEVKAIGHLYVGGHKVELRNAPPRKRIQAPDLPTQQIDPNGDFVAGATYVGYVRLAHAAHKFPILMVPGGGLSGVSFETTPDGRPGWQWFFLRAGYSTFIADLDQTGRSPWSRYPEIDPQEPAFRSSAFLWEVFRIGPPGSYNAAGGPAAFPGTQFPVGAFTTFAQSAAPRFPISTAREDGDLDALVKSVCPCILLTHSASGRAGLAAAQRWPVAIKAVISIEPSGAPADIPGGGSLPPHLFVWGDFLSPSETDKSWQEEVDAAERYSALLKGHATRADWISLPALGLRGNSHLVMLDKNSDAIAGLIAQWLRAQGL